MGGYAKRVGLKLVFNIFSRRILKDSIYVTLKSKYILYVHTYSVLLKQFSRQQTLQSILFYLKIKSITESMYITYFCHWWNLGQHVLSNYKQISNFPFVFIIHQTHRNHTPFAWETNLKARVNKYGFDLDLNSDTFSDIEELGH